MSVIRTNRLMGKVIRREHYGHNLPPPREMRVTDCIAAKSCPRERTIPEFQK